MSLYCSCGISFNIKGRNSQFDISQLLHSPELLRKDIYNANLCPPTPSFTYQLRFCLFPFLQSKQTSFRVIPHNPSLSLRLAGAPEPRHAALVGGAPPLIAPCRPVMFKAPAPAPGRPSSSPVNHRGLKNKGPGAFISGGA